MKNSSSQQGQSKIHSESLYALSDPTPTLQSHHHPLNASTHLHRLSVHVNLASASIRFLSAFSVGVSVRLAGFARFDGTSDRSSDVVDRAVEVDLIDMASFADFESMLARYVLVILDELRWCEVGVTACMVR